MAFEINNKYLGVRVWATKVKITCKYVSDEWVSDIYIQDIFCRGWLLVCVLQQHPLASLIAETTQLQDKRELTQ